MSTIDERIVSMVFENAKFEAGIAQSMATLQKLNDALAKSGQTTAFSDMDKAANKVTLQGPMSALDKLRGRLFGSGQGAAEGMSQIEAAGNKVQLEQPIRALDKVQSKTAEVGSLAAQGFSDIESAASKVSLQGITTAIDAAASKFSVLEGAASVAFGNITSQAAMKGGAFAKSFAVGPISDGLSEYKTNLGSIQTILANTDGQQISGLDQVNKHLNELNTYSDQTIYNFSEMAKNIGTFTAAGVDMDTSTQSIKGIANLAALSGSNSQQASTAMYQLSQAIAAGRVGLQDWNSVVNAGMGGAVFQKSLMRTAENMGKLKDGAVKIDKATGKATVNGESFRNSIMAKPGQESWLTSEVLTETLSQMTGDMKEADLVAKGYTKTQAAAIMKQATNAKNAATEVKTLSQVFDVAKETIGSGWAQTFSLLFGDFKESKKTFTELSNTINGFINKSSKARNKFLGDWKKFGGRTTLIKGLKVAFRDLFAVLEPVGKAFRDVFPKKTGGDLLHTTRHFVALMAALRPTAETVENIRRTFRGFFALLHTGFAIVRGVVGVIKDLLGSAGVGAGGFTSMTGSVGDFLVAIDSALTKGGLLEKFFARVTSVLRKPIALINRLKDAIASLFGDMGGTAWGRQMEEIVRFGHVLTPLQRIVQHLKDTWTNFTTALKKSPIGKWLDDLKSKMGKVGDIIAGAFTGQGLDKTMSVAQTAFVGGIFIALKKAISGGSNQLIGSLKGINGVLGGLTGQLEAMQQKLKAQAIAQIAISIGILSAAVVVLSTIDPKKLATALTAVAVGLAQLMGAFKLMTGGMGKTAIAMMPVIAASMIGLSVAVTILAGAMKIFATMSWEELAKGLAGVGGSLAAIGRAMTLLPKGPRMIAQAAAITIIAVALNILAVAVKQFATMSWEELGRGLAGVMFSLVALIVPMEALTAMGPSLLFAAPALVGISIALNILGRAIKFFGDMDMSTIAKGLITMSLSLGIIAAAMWLMPPGPYLAMQAAGMVILAVALAGIAGAMKIFGSLSVGEIAKSLIAMGGALLVLGVGLIFMEGTLPGAVALLAAAAALAILGPALGFIGQLKFSTIIRGLIAIAAILAVLAVAGTFAGPGISALGVALLPLAGVFLLTAGAIFLFAKALALLGDAGTKGISVMVTAIVAFVALLPKIVIDFIKGLVEIIAQIAIIAPKALAAIGKMLGMVIDFVIKQAAPLAMAIGALVDAIVLVLVRDAPKLFQAGITLMLKFLDGLVQNIAAITTKVAIIVVSFLNALTAKVPDLIAAGARFLGAFLDGVASKISNLAAKGITIVVRFLNGIASKIGDVIRAGSHIVQALISGFADHIAGMYHTGVDAMLKLLSGLASNVGRIISKGIEIAGKFVRGVAHGLVRLADVGAQAIIDFLNGMAKVIRTRGKEIRDAGWNLADAIMDGMVDGLKEAYNRLPAPVKAMIHVVVSAANKFLDAHSPSRVFHEIGGFIVQGLANGISDSRIAEHSMVNTADNVVQAAKKTMANVPNLLDGVMDTDPTITPVLDLTQVKAGAKQMGDITKVPPIQARSSIGQALSISSEKARIENDSLAAVAALNDKPTVHYEQTINSPDPLSTSEIYRRTNNQLSKIRREVGLQ